MTRRPHILCTLEHLIQQQALINAMLVENMYTVELIHRGRRWSRHPHAKNSHLIDSAKHGQAVPSDLHAPAKRAE